MNHFLLYSEMIKSFYRYAHAVNDISIANGHLTFVYEWNPAALGLMHEKGKQFLLSRDHQEKLVQYYNMLVQTLKPYKNNKVSIAVILKPMFMFAEAQSKISGNPVLENTALLQRRLMIQKRDQKT